MSFQHGNVDSNREKGGNSSTSGFAYVQGGGFGSGGMNASQYAQYTNCLCTSSKQYFFNSSTRCSSTRYNSSSFLALSRINSMTISTTIMTCTLHTLGTGMVMLRAVAKTPEIGKVSQSSRPSLNFTNATLFHTCRMHSEGLQNMAENRGMRVGETTRLDITGLLLSFRGSRWIF